MKTLNQFREDIDTADIKLSKSGRKYRAHRVTFNTREPIDTDGVRTTEEILSDIQKDLKRMGANTDIQQESAGMIHAMSAPHDPPAVLMLKRKSIRLFPDNTRIALYYSPQLNKYFSVPYGNDVQSVVQSSNVP